MRRGAAFVFALLLGCSTWAVGPSAGSVAAQGSAESGNRASQTVGTVRMARASWETGWFQAEVYRQLLEHLGYAVSGPVTMDNAEFYESVARGDVDLWVNGWFPLHEPLLNAQGGAERVGTQVASGALQGYFADIATVAEYGISDLADLADPELAALFDAAGDGRADLVGCNPGWSCAAVIDHHIAAYGLGDTVEQVQGEYSPLMAELLERHAAGHPVLFYTWTPNWTVSLLVPGTDVAWLQTPFPSLPGTGGADLERTRVGGLTGCASDPCAIGWPPNDIAAVANSAFLAANPPARSLLEQVRIPLEDILAQNEAMISGEGDPEDIARHAAAWLAANAATVDEWLQQADPDAAPFEVRDDPGTELTEVPVLTVAARVLSPFVTYEDRSFGGFEVDLARMIAHEMGTGVRFHSADIVAKQIDDVSRGAADLALGGIEITRPREEAVDFSLPVLATGLTILVSDQRDPSVWDRIRNFFASVADSDVPWQLMLFGVAILVAAHVIWWLERRHNEDFASPYRRGLWDSFYWSIVTMSTVGYGDKVARRAGGRAFALLWIVFGTLLFAAFTASIASSLAVSQLQGDIRGPADLPGARVATVASTAGEAYLTTLGAGPVLTEEIGDAYELLEQNHVDAVVFDAPVLRYHAARHGSGTVTTVGGTFDNVRYGLIVSPERPELREQINRSLLRLIETGAYDRLFDRWFGDLD